MTRRLMPSRVLSCSRRYLLVAVAFWCSCPAGAQSDSLSSSIANGILDSNWTAYAANPNGYTSSYSITPGSYLTLNNREWLFLTNPLQPGNNAITVAGTFDLTKTSPAADFLTVALHTGANTTAGVGRGSNYGVALNSLLVEFSLWGGTGGGVVVGLTQGSETPVYSTVLSAGLLNQGQAYNFSIADNGTAVAVSLNGNLVGAYNYAANPNFTASGSNVLFYSRESTDSLQLSSLSVVAIPEPTACSLLGFGLVLLGGVVWRKRQAGRRKILRGV